MGVEGRPGKVQQVAGMRWVRHHFVCSQGAFVLVLLPFVTGQGKGKKSLQMSLRAAEQRQDRALSPLLLGTENLQLPLNFDFIHSHLFQAGKPNTSFNYRKGWASPGLVQKRLCCEVLELDPEHHWAASPWGTEPFQGWWGVLQN